jgi:hypothetical protein
LIPQNPVENLTAVLERLAVNTHKYVQLIPLNETKWTAFITSHLYDCPDDFNWQQNIPDVKVLPMKWFQDDSSITITLDVDSTEIEVDKERITSPSLKGHWWGSVSEIDITSLDKMTQIFLTLENPKRWPYLVRGGNPDGLSCYFLALICLRLGQSDFSLMWQRQGALLGNSFAIQAWAMSLVNFGQNHEAINWLCRSILQFGDHESAYVLAVLLLRKGESCYDPRLAEFLLVRLCLEQFSDAYSLLGELYLTGAEGVKRMPAKARFLLHMAVIMDDENALKLLQEGNFSETEEPEKGKESPGQESQQDAQATVADWGIAAALVGSAVAVGYFTYRWFARKSR